MKVPEGWNKVTTLDVVQDPKISIRIGPFGSSLKKHELTDSGIRVLFIENVVNNKFEYKTGKFITPEKYKELKGFTVKPNDILVTMMGTIGRICIVPENIGTAIISSHLLKISLDQKIILPKYFALLLQSPITFNQMKKESRGIAMPGLNSKIIKNLEFILPSIKTQNKIIQKLEDILVTLEEKKQEISYLVEHQKIRLKYLSDHADSILISKLIPEKLFEGSNQTIADILENKLQGLYYNKGYFDNGTPLLRITDMYNDGSINYKSLPNIQASPNEIKRFSLEYGDVLVARTGGAGRCVIFDRKHFVMLFAGYLIRFRFKIENNPFFILLCLLHPFSQKSLSQSIHGAVLKNVNAENIKKLIIPKINKNQQDEIVKIYQDQKKQTIIQKEQLEWILKRLQFSFKNLNGIENSILNSAFSGKFVN